MKYGMVLAFASLMCAQPVPVLPPTTVNSGIVMDSRMITYTVSQQPLPILIAALGSKLKGVAGYSVRSCNASNNEQATVSGGRIAQAIEQGGLSTIPVQLASIAAQAAVANSKLSKMVEYTGQVAFYAALTMAANLIKFRNADSVAAKAAHIGAIGISHEADRAANKLAKQLPDPLERFKGQVLTDADISLTPGGCSTLLFMGNYQSGFKPIYGSVERTR